MPDPPPLTTTEHSRCVYSIRSDVTEVKARLLTRRFKGSVFCGSWVLLLVQPFSLSRYFTCTRTCIKQEEGKKKKMKKCNLWQKLVSQVIFQIFIKNLVLDMLHSNSILVLYLVYFFLKIHLYFIILSLAKRSHKWVKNDCISNEKAQKCFILLSYLC